MTVNQLMNATPIIEATYWNQVNYVVTDLTDGRTTGFGVSWRPSSNGKILNPVDFYVVRLNQLAGVNQ
jgi:hypothetical protein